jgi:hypothetical protein
LQLRAQSQKHQRRMLDAKQQGDALGRIERIRAAKARRKPDAVKQNAARTEELQPAQAVT